MLTRRRAILGTAAAGLVRRSLSAKASQPMTPVHFEVPRNACDCHTHIFADPKDFPYWSGRVYTPETALPAEMSALHRALHLDRVVIVTPSVYGTDNAATLYGIKARGATARGVVSIDDKTPESDLDKMGQAGVCGIRINLTTAGPTDAAAARTIFQTAAERVKRRGWHLDILATPALIAATKDLVESSPVPVIFDHFGGTSASSGINQPGFGDLVALVRSGKAYVKISAVYRSSTQTPNYADMAPFAKALIGANPDRIVWGTDWPHPDPVTPAGHRVTDITPLLPIDDGLMLNQVAVWTPDAATRKKILVENPARLYRF